MYIVLAHSDINVLIQLLHSNQRMHPTLLKLQYYKTPAATCFGPYRPIIREHTTVLNICLTFSHVRELPIALQYVIYIHTVYVTDGVVCW